MPNIFFRIIKFSPSILFKTRFSISRLLLSASWFLFDRKQRKGFFPEIGSRPVGPPCSGNLCSNEDSSLSNKASEKKYPICFSTHFKETQRTKPLLFPLSSSPLSLSSSYGLMCSSPRGWHTVVDTNLCVAIGTPDSPQPPSPISYSFACCLWFSVRELSREPTFFSTALEVFFWCVLCLLWTWRWPQSGNSAW